MSKTDKDLPLKVRLQELGAGFSEDDLEIPGLNVVLRADDENEDEPETARDKVRADVRTNNHGQGKRRRRWATKRLRQGERQVEYLARVSIDKDSVDDRLAIERRTPRSKCPRYLMAAAA